MGRRVMKARSSSASSRMRRARPRIWNDPFVPGKARRVRDGSDATIIANGTTVHIAAEAA